MTKISAGPGRFVQGYAKFVQRRAYFIIGFWTALFVLGAWKGLELMQTTSIQFDAPEGSKAAVASDKMDLLFHKQATSSPIIYVMHEIPGCNTTLMEPGPEGILRSRFIPMLDSTVQAYINEHPEALGYITNTSYSTSLDPIMPEFNGDFGNTTFNFSGIPFPIKPLTEGDHWAFVTVNVQLDSLSLSKTSSNLATYMIDQKKNVMDVTFGEKSVCIESWLTGLLPFGVEIMEGTEKNFLTMDGTALPLAFLTLMIILGAARLLIIPLINILISILGAFLIMWRVSLTFTVISFAPSVMMSVLLAMSIDYSLFQLSRYREELLAGRTPLEAVIYMTTYAGHTILVSGSTLTICFFSLMLFPSVMLQSMGLGCAIGLALAITINLTLTPALLLGFPEFFKNCILPSKILNFFCGKCYKPNSRAGDSYIVKGINDFNDDDNDYDDDDMLLESESNMKINRSGSSDLSLKNELQEEIDQIKRTKWYKFVKAVTKFPWIVTLILIGLTVPCTMRAMEFKRTLGLLSTLPRDSEGTAGFKKIDEHFGGGTLTPYFLIAEVPQTIQAKVLGDLTQDLLAGLNQDSSAINFVNSSVALCVDGEIPFIPNRNSNDTCSEVNLVEICGYACCGNQGAIIEELKKFDIANPTEIVNEACDLCPNFVHCNPVSKQSDASISQIFLTEDTANGDGLKWYPAALDAIDSVLKSKPEYAGSSAYLGGGASVNIAAVDVVYDRFPEIVGITAAFVLLWIGLSFRSLLIPLRAILTIGMTLSYVFATAVWVYQYGILDWLHFPGLGKSGKTSTSNTGAMMWIVPVMCFSVLVGLGLDYDVFLISRIVEYRKRGLSNRAAIVYGTSKTGGIITAAGAIMAIAFAGLLFCGEEVLNETAFFFVFAVLVDTMIIRTMLVPSLMIIMGDLNWWPLRVPNPILYLDGERYIA